MNLKELKTMIAEEYSNYLKEQGAPGAPGAPAVAVSAKDVDAGGDENPEETLRDIYDMLKDYFEGGAADDMGDDPADAGADAGEEDDSEAPDDKALQERFQKLANIIKG